MLRLAQTRTALIGKQRIASKWQAIYLAAVINRSAEPCAQARESSCVAWINHVRSIVASAAANKPENGYKSVTGNVEVALKNQCAKSAHNHTAWTQPFAFSLSTLIDLPASVP
ncbi:MAG: hypothetical protein AB7O62_21915 [Pirellulales bacterium]